MKKNALLLLLLSATLSGCDFLPFLNTNSNGNSETQQNQNNNQNTGDNTGGNTGGNTDDNTGGNTDDNTGTEGKDDLLQEYTATIETHGLYFNTNFKEGTNFTITSPKKTDDLREYLEGPLEYEDLFTSLQCDYCTTRKVDGDTYLQIGTGSYAKGNFNYGTLIFGSKVKIYNVKVTAFNYSNPYPDYASGEIVPNVDTDCHLKLDSVDLNMELPATSAPVEKTVEKHYENGTNSFTLVAMSGRVLIKEMTITWRG